MKYRVNTIVKLREYHRQKQRAKTRNAEAIDSIPRAVVGRITCYSARVCGCLLRCVIGVLC